MSVTDSLLKVLKGHTLKFVETAENLTITDDNAYLQPFCQTLEQILQKGLKPYANPIGFFKSTSSWNWLEAIATNNTNNSFDFRVPFSYSSAVEAVKRCRKVTKCYGKLRLLIRTCLVSKCFHVPVRLLLENGTAGSVYDSRQSIIGDEILAEILLSVLLQCSQLNFKLNLNNALFLDDTWQLPNRDKIEFVPCKELGICISFISGKAVVIQIKENSVAEEIERMQVGDVIDELNGETISASTQGKLSHIMKKGAGQPINVAIIKAHFSKTGDIFPPMVNILRRADLDISELHAKWTRNEECSREDNSISVIRPGYLVTYVGCTSTGMEGDVKQIEYAMAHVLHTTENKLHRQTMFECLEIGVRVTDSETGKIILKHSYMEISSCGRTVNTPKNFAYIAGNKNCNMADNFVCYIFQSENYEYVSAILQSIGQGFQRTHFAV